MEDILPDFPNKPKPLPTCEELDVVLQKQYADLKELYTNEYDYKFDMSIDLENMIHRRKMALWSREVEKRMKHALTKEGG